MKKSIGLSLFFVALGIVGILAGRVVAIQVNPASNVIADSAATAETIVYRDTSGDFSSGTISTVGEYGMKVSSSATSAFSLRIDGAYTTAQIQAKTPTNAGELVYNTTLPNLCISTGTTVQAYKLAGTAATTCQ